jgi:hypothetical protein
MPVGSARRPIDHAFFDSSSAVHGAIDLDLSASDAPVAQLPGAAAAAEHSEGIAKYRRRLIRQ